MCSEEENLVAAFMNMENAYERTGEPGGKQLGSVAWEVREAVGESGR